MQKDIENLAKTASGLEKLALELRLPGFGNDNDIIELGRLATSLSSMISAGYFDEPAKNRLFSCCNQIQQCCDWLIHKPGIIAPINFVYLRHHYQKLSQKIAEFGSSRQETMGGFVSTKPPIVSPKNLDEEFRIQGEPLNVPRAALTERQRSILGFFDTIAAGAPLKFKRIKTYFYEFGERTLRNDLHQLVKLGHLQQRGFARGSNYEKING